MKHKYTMGIVGVALAFLAVGNATAMQQESRPPQTQSSMSGQATSPLLSLVQNLPNKITPVMLGAATGLALVSLQDKDASPLILACACAGGGLGSYVANKLLKTSYEKQFHRDVTHGVIGGVFGGLAGRAVGAFVGTIAKIALGVGACGVGLVACAMVYSRRAQASQQATGSSSLVSP